MVWGGLWSPDEAAWVAGWVTEGRSTHGLGLRDRGLGEAGGRELLTPAAPQAPGRHPRLPEPRRRAPGRGPRLPRQAAQRGPSLSHVALPTPRSAHGPGSTPVAAGSRERPPCEEFANVKNEGPLRIRALTSRRPSPSARMGWPLWSHLPGAVFPVRWGRAAREGVTPTLEAASTQLWRRPGCAGSTERAGEVMSPRAGPGGSSGCFCTRGEGP